MSAAGWKFERRAGQCGGCETPFVPGATVTSALYDEGEQFERRDWCNTCAADPERLREPFSRWAAEVPEPEAKKAAFDLGVARDFLVRLLQKPDPSQDSLRYLLSLLLMRKRVVRVLEQFTGEDGVERMTFRIPSDETEHEIPCPELDEDESTSLREQLGRLFDLG